MKILVLGGTGFIGWEVVKKISNPQNEITVLYMGKRPKDFLDYPAQWLEKDLSLLSQEELANITSQFDSIIYLIHGAPIGNISGPKVNMSNLVNSTLLLVTFLDVLVNLSKKPTMIYVSSGGAVYGDIGDDKALEDQEPFPISDYGIQKLIAEKYLHLYNCQYGLEYYILRVSNPFGENQYSNGVQGIIPVLIEKIYLEQPLSVLGDGSIIRDYIAVDDVASAFEKILTYSGKKRIFNIGTGVGTSVNELIQKIEKLQGKKAIIKHLPFRKGDVRSNVLNADLALKEFLWSPKVSLDEALRRSVDQFLINQKKEVF